MPFPGNVGTQVPQLDPDRSIEHISKGEPVVALFHLFKLLLYILIYSMGDDATSRKSGTYQFIKRSSDLPCLF